MKKKRDLQKRMNTLKNRHKSKGSFDQALLTLGLQYPTADRLER
jgi:hypothetical protein